MHHVHLRLTVHSARQCVASADSGKILQVRMFTHNQEGVIMVKFQTEEAAQQCIKVMEGRWFGGRQVKAHMWDGIANYHVKSKQENAAEQAARLLRFGEQLEQS